MKKNRILAGEVSTNAFLTFPRCMGITTKTIPMQHGKAETENCDTSRARTSILTDHWILLLWIFVDLGSAIWHPRREFKGKLENYQKTRDFFKIVKMQNVAKTIGGSKISKRRGHNNKGHDLRPLGFPGTRMRFMSKSSQDSHERG